MSWHARVDLHYVRDHARTSVRHAHEGPLRILRTLYPEGEAVAHNVLVHPPSGIVGGDTLDVQVHLAPGTHAFITTPGAARFYRSEGAAAVQRASLQLDEGARLEWLPMEALAYNGCLAENHLVAQVAPGAELLAWDVTALGLPAAQQPFLQGRFLQHLEVASHWLERATIDASDAALMDGPLGLAGRRCLATLVFAAGQAIAPRRRDQALELARALTNAHGAGAMWAGVTAPGPHVVAVRVLSDLVEPAMHLLRQVHAAWRPALWNLPPAASRLWAL